VKKSAFMVCFAGVLLQKEFNMDPMQNPEERYEGQPDPAEHLRSQGEASLEKGWRKTQEGIRSMKEQASESFESMRRQFSDSARRVLIQQKDRSVTGLKRLSAAIHDAASRLDSGGDHTLAEYTDLLGNQVDRAANYLQERDAGEVMRDLESLVRRQAGLIVGGMFVTGLVVARLIKASQERQTTALAPQDLTPSPAPSVETGEPGMVSPSPGTMPPASQSRFGQGLGPLE